MTDKKITQLNNITGANLVDADEFVVVDISADETKAITLGELKEAFDAGSGFVRVTGDTMTGDLSFGDNDKAIFGAGSDLQIYHQTTGTVGSYISDQGAGPLNLLSGGVRLKDTTDTDTMLAANAGGSVTLYYDNAPKLATTNTGVDVTGALTVDGVATVNSNILEVSSTAPNIRLTETDTTDQNTQLLSGGGTLRIRTASDDYSTVTERMRINHSTGDISFYEDTGTTAKFFWDASAESLGIGTSSPTNATLHTYSNTDNNYVAKFEQDHATGWGVLIDTDGTANDPALWVKNATDTIIWAAQSGKVGIGTSSPKTQLELFGEASTYNFNAGTDPLANLAIINDNVNSGTGPSIVLGSTYSGSATVANARIFAERQSTGSTNAGATDLIFEVGQASGSALAEAMRIDSRGFVGINETSPATELDVNGTTTSNQYLLDNIAKDISDTAVDVFVYDTSKDSDGGAWRKRTQGTSWYNETLNTSTRGARREFPAVAVIVAVSGVVKIYDGDDPALPMWMVFHGGRTASAATTRMIPTTAFTTAGVSMLNGKLCLASNGDAAGVDGLCVIDFLNEKALWHTDYTSAASHSLIGLQISKRNEFFTRVLITGGSSIADSGCNDVAITVLPNAPIDSATGLPVPTIAVATDGGVSVITDSGAVYDSAYTDANKNVTFDEDNTLYYMRKSSSYLLSMAEPSEYTSGDGFGTGIASTAIGTQEFDLISARSQTTTAFGKGIVASGGSSSSPSTKLLGLYALDKSNLTNTMAAGIHSEYNTGWMNGDIKLATLSDTDDTDVVGLELVTNGTFATDTSGWTANANTTLSVASGALRITAIASGVLSAAYQTFTTVIGKKYTVTMETVTSTGSGGLYMRVGTGAQSGNLLDVNATTAGTYSRTFTAISTTTVFTALAGSSQAAGEYKEVDNISVRLAEADRSVNGNGLQVFGTVTKNPVATGADLVAYSGFSSSNYLEQPYNSDLDFGTGDFCIMGWARTGSTGNEYLISRTVKDSGLNPRIGVRGSSDTALGFNISGVALADTGVVLNSTTWTQFVFLRKSGVVYAYVNGELKASATNTADLTLADSQLFIGGWGSSITSGGSTVCGGSLALFRISGTAPSAEQIAKIYNDEKVLFQENAQATLVGNISTSMNVYALGYDKTTELLHVGTTSGRSVFQGLRRVENTSNNVTVAISASNNLVVEE